MHASKTDRAVIDNDIGKSAGRIEAIREAFRETWNTLTKIPLKSNNLQVAVRLRQAVRPLFTYIISTANEQGLVPDFGPSRIYTTYRRLGIACQEHEARVSAPSTDIAWCF
jgi:hypothetical protein